MAGRILGGSLLAAAALMAWGTAFWAASPFMKTYMPPLPAEAEVVVPALQQAGLETGTYLYPHCIDANNEEEMARVERLRRQGPFVQLTYIKDGVDPNMGKLLGAGFVHYFVTSLVAALLLWLAMPGLPTYIKRVATVTLAGLFAAVFINASNPIWFFHPWDFYLALSVYYVVGAVIMGLVLALFVKPRVVAELA